MPTLQTLMPLHLAALLCMSSAGASAMSFQQAPRGDAHAFAPSAGDQQADDAADQQERHAFSVSARPSLNSRALVGPAAAPAQPLATPIPLGQH